MSEVIRDAIIRLRLEMQRGKLEAGDVAAVARKYTELHQAAKESQQAVHDNIGAARQYASAAREANSAATGWAAGLKKLNAEWRQQGSGRNSWGEGMQRMQTQASAGKFKEIQLSERLAAVRRRNAEEERAALESAQASAEKAARAHQAFGIHAARAFKDGLEGTVQFARGVALMTASSEEDTRKLLEMFAKIEAATALVRGAANLSKFAAAFGPIGIAVGTATAAVGVGVAAWKRYSDAMAEARRKANELEDAMAAIREETRLAQEGMNRDFGQAGIDNALTPEERTKRLEQERIRAAKEFANIKAEQAGTSWGKYLRGLTADQRTEEIGRLARSQPDEVQRQRDIEQRLSDSAKHQANIAKEQAETQKRLLDAVQENQYNLGTAATAFAAGTPGFGGLAALGAAQTANTQTAQFEGAVSKVLLDAQKSLDKFVALMRDAAERMREFDDALRAQSAANPK